ncbi:hypothetical protein SJZ84_20345 [Hafnia paralvei]|uniref:hypothetical protein n=1 Tax=Hafnia TaxID=568 RepID=UPI00061CE3BA|nr:MULTISPECIES: hypothetical protein [Hafnia]KKF38577.1 hypothetical protein PU01_22575 [Hafnia alvei]MBW3478484.1 hypothetical protein [Hafnia alvei]MDX6913164.1 hypothetical protein [Hafnia paralvei]
MQGSISTKNDIEYIKTVFDDLSDALMQMAHGQIPLPAEISGLLSDIRKPLAKGRLPCVFEVDRIIARLHSFFNAIKQQQQQVACADGLERQMHRLKNVRYFLVVLTNYPETQQVSPGLRRRRQRVKTMILLFLGLVLSFFAVAYLFASQTYSGYGIYLIAMTVFFILPLVSEDSSVEMIIISLSGVSIFTVAALCVS